MQLEQALLEEYYDNEEAVVIHRPELELVRCETLIESDTYRYAKLFISDGIAHVFDEESYIAYYLKYHEPALIIRPVVAEILAFRREYDPFHLLESERPGYRYECKPPLALIERIPVLNKHLSAGHNRFPFRFEQLQDKDSCQVALLFNQPLN